jgi:myosin-5
MAELDARRTEVLSVAAKTIQGKMRTHIMRKKFVSLRKASVCFQAVWRGMFCLHLTLDQVIFILLIMLKLTLCGLGTLACKLYDRMRKESASIKIQKNQRRHQARRSYKLLNASVLVVQTALRAMAARNDFRYKKRSKAAVTIQVVFSSS